ncbi:hypothetical protein C8J57DRAFT_1711116 [Mycena rebaudengoi]|nr:hypothetical protein C8J57DRAFT_1733777 [Mycena rebaudengoi]KAJ7281395.1 hypothetical protein C8J57DRAFT_1711116 [Mycena rebaudengoi]
MRMLSKRPTPRQSFFRSYHHHPRRHSAPRSSLPSSSSPPLLWASTPSSTSSTSSPQRITWNSEFNPDSKCKPRSRNISPSTYGLCHYKPTHWCVLCLFMCCCQFHRA